MGTKPPKQSADADGKSIGRSLKMPADLDAKVSAIAEHEDRSWSYIVIRAVREMVEKHAEAGDGKKAKR